MAERRPSVIGVDSSNDQAAWVAPGAWAPALGVVLVVLVLGLAVAPWLRAAGATVGGVLILYFAVRYVVALLRGEIPDRHDDDPPGGWSTQGPFTG
jgi:hypothetical protein